MTNFMNNVADTEIDFPEFEPAQGGMRPRESRPHRAYHGQYSTEWRHCVCYFHENQEAPS